MDLKKKAPVAAELLVARVLHASCDLGVEFIVLVGAKVLYKRQVQHDDDDESFGFGWVLFFFYYLSIPRCVRMNLCPDGVRRRT
jgi:hypothetical protein